MTKIKNLVYKNYVLPETLVKELKDTILSKDYFFRFVLSRIYKAESAYKKAPKDVIKFSRILLKDLYRRHPALCRDLLVKYLEPSLVLKDIPGRTIQQKLLLTLDTERDPLTLLAYLSVNLPIPALKTPLESFFYPHKVGGYQER